MISRLLRDWIADGDFHYGRRIAAPNDLIRRCLNPSLRAVLLARLTTNGNSVLSKVGRSRLIRRYACDISPGAKLGAAIDFPHPVGIVIGSGSEIGNRVRIYQHVTIGRHRDQYPVILDDVHLYPGCVITGGITLGACCRIGPNAVVQRDVAAGSRYTAKDLS